MTPPPQFVFFVSYARLDTEYEPHRMDLKKFVEDLGARVANKLARTKEGICFFDESSLETGMPWRPGLAHALKTTPVIVALYSTPYFASEWCGKEFQVFLNRAGTRDVAGGIVPVIWDKCTTLPPAVNAIQYKDDALPPAYSQVGLHQLLSLKTVYGDLYQLSVEALAERVVKKAQAALAPAAILDLDTVPSAWEISTASDPQSHTEGGIAKTCFVFVSRRGWHWQPYPTQGKTIGAMAQQISGSLGLRYEEIDCDARLSQKLKETRSSNVPTLLFGDPGSLLDGQYAQPMREYDDMYLLNCGTLMPWSAESTAQNNGETLWNHIKNAVCRQKTDVPPPNHEWRSIFSQDDLETKTRMTIENIRLRLLEKILGGGNGGGPNEGTPPAPRATTVLRATDAVLTGSAAAQGIDLGKAPQIESPTQ